VVLGRSGTVRAANGEAVLPIVVVGRIDVAGAVESEVVGVAAIRDRSRRPVKAVVAGVVEQVAGILIDVAAPRDGQRHEKSCPKPNDWCGSRHANQKTLI